MARKHPVSSNQTALWTYQALAPEWGSPALRHPEKTRKSPRLAAKNSSRAAGGKGQAKVKARPSSGRQTSSHVETQQDATSKNEQVRMRAKRTVPRRPNQA